MLKKFLLRILLFLNFTTFSGATFAAGSGNENGTTSNMPAGYVKAVKSIETGNHQEATQFLKLSDSKKPKDADINNLLGFAQRKTGDVDEASACYRKALKIDGKHKSTLSYQGKLFWIVGNKAAADGNLRKLDKICWLGCRELDVLRTAIESYKS